MYLSSLKISTDTPRGRNWLGNPYRVHQRLLMAFPQGESGRVLFRIEEDRDPPRILVQAPTPADWDAAFADHPVLLSRPVQKEIRSVCERGQRLRFLLRANPTVRRVRWEGEGEARKAVQGPRMGLMKETEQRGWLARKGEAGGFRPLVYEVRPRGKAAFKAGAGDARIQTHYCVEYEGVLEVADPELFRTAWESGIGAGKGFGFGLLSLAPA